MKKGGLDLRRQLTVSATTKNPSVESALSKGEGTFAWIQVSYNSFQLPEPFWVLEALDTQSPGSSMHPGNSFPLPPMLTYL